MTKYSVHRCIGKVPSTANLPYIQYMHVQELLTHRNFKETQNDRLAGSVT
jgi:hypothetical protein